MKLSNLALLCIGVLSMSAYASSDCLFVTGVRCSPDCDDNSLYKTCGGNYYGKTFFSFRPQDSDSSRRIQGWFNADYIWPRDPETRYVLTVSPQYTHSFNSKHIAQWFFFNGCDAMTVGIPSQYETFDIDGSQIGLSLGTLFDVYTDQYKLQEGKIGNVWAKPEVQNYIIDVDLWYDLSAWHENLWSRLECVIVNMKTNMHMCASGKGSQETAYPFGLYSLGSTANMYGDYICNTTPVPYNSILCALEGNQDWGSVLSLESGKFSRHGMSKWGVAGLHFDLGYDIYDSLPWFCAGSLHVVFPTGSRPNGTYVFEPVIGANKSWQVGATAIAHYVRECAHGDIGVYFYGVGTHLFNSTQDRVFSLKENGPGSQLLLLKQFQVSQVGLINAQPEANIFCGRTKIGSTLMFDGSLMFQYSRNRLVADIGYNLWARTKETREKTVWFRGFYVDSFGIKGNNPMDIQVEVGGPTAPVQCLGDTMTDSTATISGATYPDSSPVFIQPGDVNYGSALSPAAISHKLFAAAGFKSAWFALLSGEVEFGANNAAINQWGIMLKVGGEF
jgi:hypothetical protein